MVFRWNSGVTAVDMLIASLIDGFFDYVRAAA
jgi:hypothetical protein